ncbi:carbohydrate porin [Flavobacterium sp. HJJ]|uniref:carbohydrate porin n=1 Tax=Flavobacterium sp. HJJ TaxID=2783792 RepID=UPI00188C1172|nr:carbohydrate porin [Flavobacterium sp. HJJ]MBF4472129.1 carbohydrate porin [Flavobacterium sp. HJJ]
MALPIVLLTLRIIFIFFFLNRKQDIAFGARGTWFLKDWLYLLHEFDMTWGKDGTQDFGQMTMTKFTIVPTFVSTAVKDVWAKPHFRLVYR